MSDKFNTALEELKTEVNLLYQTIDKKTKSIIDLEQNLRKIKIFIPFKTEFYLKNEPLPLWMAWEGAEENPKNFRMFIIKTKDNILEKKSLIELPLSDRLIYVKYIDSFIEKFTEYLKNKNTEFVNTLWVF